MNHSCTPITALLPQRTLNLSSRQQTEACLLHWYGSTRQQRGCRNQSWLVLGKLKATKQPTTQHKTLPTSVFQLEGTMGCPFANWPHGNPYFIPRSAASYLQQSKTMPILTTTTWTCNPLFSTTGQSHRQKSSTQMRGSLTFLVAGLHRKCHW